MANKSAGSTESEDVPSGSADDQSGNSDVTEIHLVEVDENSTDGVTTSPPSSQPRKRRFSFDELRQRQLATFIRNISPRKSGMLTARSHCSHYKGNQYRPVFDLGLFCSEYDGCCGCAVGNEGRNFAIVSRSEPRFNVNFL